MRMGLLSEIRRPIIGYGGIAWNPVPRLAVRLGMPREPIRGCGRRSTRWCGWCSMVFSLGNLFTWKVNVQCLYLENSKRSDP